MPAFHEILFPLDVSLAASGGPERVTEVVTSVSGREERNARRADSRRRFDAGYGVKTLAALHDVVAFFEERRGRLYGFRWRDRLDHASSRPGTPIAATDQTLGTGDASRAVFALAKTYGAHHAPYARAISKPVAGTVRVAVGGVEAVEGTSFAVDLTRGLVTFLPGHVPPAGARVSAGFLFDVPVRFDTDFLEVNLTAFAAGEIPRIPILEIRP
ncbi:DUF2460 domain-containing protein [Aquabacter spiritensis]|uniref:Uncharacterized protein (TIGR02217 family) n=1 Tax=Aquabacter spiritensis TaxID=933073 RepID=A0A4V2UYL6_9HYPH|nr:DUF2460 domain-containing protein [Aquabacter spiritensis]TCT07618.1 uncharacterized protein (TIGR02217 family) [Aquabacter spiritensis]